MRRLLVPLIAATALAACTQTPAETARAQQDAAADQARLAKRLAGLVPGPPQTCVDQFQLRDAQLSSYGTTILYTLGSGIAYRSDTNGCTGVGGNGRNILVTKTFSSQLCQGDIATTVDNSSRFPTGSCSFGPFVRYARP